jgi:hypothetical protein
MRQKALVALANVGLSAKACSFIKNRLERNDSLRIKMFTEGPSAPSSLQKLRSGMRNHPMLHNAYLKARANPRLNEWLMSKSNIKANSTDINRCLTFLRSEFNRSLVSL